MGMREVTAAEFQRSSGELQDHADQAPVAITRHGRKRHVLLSYSEYERLLENDRKVVRLDSSLDDHHWDIILDGLKNAKVPDDVAAMYDKLGE